MNATIQHTLRQELASQHAIHTSHRPDAALCLSHSELGRIQSCTQASLVILEQMFASESNEGCAGEETLTPRERAAFVVAIKSMLEQLEGIADAVDGRTRAPTGTSHYDDAASAQPAQTPAHGQGPQFADIAHLVEPGRVPTVDDCVRALETGLTRTTASHERATAYFSAIRALLPSRRQLADPVPHALGAADIKALHELLDDLDDEFGFMAEVMEEACTAAGVISQTRRNDDMPAVAEGLDHKQGSAA